MNEDLNKGLPEVLKIVLFSKDYREISSSEKQEAIDLALKSNREELELAKFYHDYKAISKIKAENVVLNKLMLEAQNE